MVSRVHSGICSSKRALAQDDGSGGGDGGGITVNKVVQDRCQRAHSDSVVICINR